MKRVSITFLPSVPVLIRMQVVKTTPYTFINYATAVNTSVFLNHPVGNLTNQQFSLPEYCMDITFFLTKLHQYIFVVASQREDRSRLTMWTQTTTLACNKMKFVTLVTTLNKFGTQTTSGSTVSYSFQSARRTSSKQNNQSP